MPVARFQLPDGRIARFEVPAGTTPEQAQSLITPEVLAQVTGGSSAEAKPQTSGLGALDAANALATGFNRGITRLGGLGVDTMANVVDIPKAIGGTILSWINGLGPDNGKPRRFSTVPPEALQVKPRSEVVGSGDFLVNKARSTAPGGAVLNPINPEYEGGGWQTAGSGLTAIVNPQSRAQAVNQGILGVTSALAGKTVMDATGNPALAITASLAPGGVQQGVTEATKFAVRGGEAGRRQMQQRIQDLKNAGIDNPTLGLASGNRTIGGLENILQNTPGAVGVMDRARNRVIGGLQATADQAADTASTNRGSLAAGQAIQGGIHQFRDSFKDGQRQVYGKLDQHIGPQVPTGVENTRETLGRLNADIKGAPNLSRFFKNEKIRALEDALQADTSGSPQSVHVYSQPPRAGGGIMNAPVPQDPLQVVIPQGPQRNALPFEAVKKTRTLVGDEMADHSLMSTVPQSKWKALYGALTEDIGNTARATSPEAAQAFNRANAYTRAGLGRLEKLSPFLQAHHADLPPEQAFTTLQNAARENVSILQAVKKSLPEGARGQIAGTVIDRLGRATNANQNDTGTAWSPETFLTNWNKMTPKAREEIFSGFPNSKQVKADIDAVAKATSMMRDSSKLWANPSGTGANLGARLTLAGLGLGGGASAAGLLNPMVPLGIGAGLLGTYGLARGLTSKSVVDAMAQPSYVSPSLLAAETIPMFSTGLLNQ